MKTGRKAEEISAFMSDEKWWTGDEAVENRFCDELMFEESQTVIENANRIVVNSTPIDLTHFQTFPKTLLNSPHNQGSFTNSAINQGQQKKEEKEMALENSTITTIEALKTTYPDLIATIENNAAEEERERIKAIQNMTIDGFESIAEDAMFENPITAAEVAVKIINEQKKQGKKYLASREEDVDSSGVNTIGTYASEQATKETDIYNAAIDRLFPKSK
jgi:hypothetical protein